MSGRHYYTDEKNAQIVIALLKAYGIKHLILSPGATNDCFVLSVQDDPFFKLYSAAEYGVCDICEVSNYVECLTALLKVALRYCRRKLVFRLTYVGAPRDKDKWIVKNCFHRQSKLVCNPFSYSCKDEEIRNAA